MDPASFFFITVLLAAASSGRGGDGSLLVEAKKAVDRYYQTFLDHYPMWYGDPSSPEASMWNTGTRIPGAATAEEKIINLNYAREGKTEFLEKARRGYASRLELQEIEGMFDELLRWMSNQISRQEWRDFLSLCTRRILEGQKDRGIEGIKFVASHAYREKLLPPVIWVEFIRGDEAKAILPVLRDTYPERDTYPKRAMRLR